MERKSYFQICILFRKQKIILK